jgi:TolB protein
MTTRRTLVALIAVLSVLVVVGGVAVAGLAGLAYYGLSQRADEGLLVVDGSRRLRLLASDGVERLLADDISDDMFRYPATAPDGERIAFISEDEQGFSLNSVHLGTGERTELYRSASEPPLYVIWSGDGSKLSFISNRPEGGFNVHTVASDGSAESAVIDSTIGSSFFAWQPDGGRLLLHIGGSSMENGKVAVYEQGSSEPSQEFADPGLFQSPAWSMDGDTFFYVAQPVVSGQMSPDQVESVLTRVSADGSGPRALASEKMAAMIFSRSPASDDIAYITIDAEGFGALKVVDAVGGEARTVSRPGETIPAFFWSPDGSQLAYLTFEAGEAGLPLLTWHVVARGGGAVRDLSSFTPSEAFMGMVSFFDAYALALDLWSPDGSMIAYGTDEGVYVVDVASGEATRRGDGVLAMWAK